MDYPHIFVICMGLGTVFFGLICLIILTTIMGNICQKFVPEAPAAPKAAPVPVPVAANEPDRQVIAAVISAAIAEELGTDITGIRILSMKKL